jgi:hypothetical protein
MHQQGGCGWPEARSRSKAQPFGWPHSAHWAAAGIGAWGGWGKEKEFGMASLKVSLGSVQAIVVHCAQCQHASLAIFAWLVCLVAFGTTAPGAGALHRECARRWPMKKSPHEAGNGG